MKRMKNTDEDEEFCMQRFCELEMNSKSENDVLFIGTVTMGKIVMPSHIFTHWVV